MAKNLKFGCREGYGNFDSMMQKSSARRATQFEQLTNSIGAVLGEICQILFTSDLQGDADHFKKVRQWSRSEKYGTNGSFLGKSDTPRSFPLVSERYNGAFPLKMAADVKKVHFWALTHDHLEPHNFCKAQPILFVHASIDSPLIALP
ncbi:MAG: hypothetical protein GY821_16310, partial [Gammaproteobacteria bacterium]|nr:hypothetical protein [Gammaproteobacteria bacterium]